MGCLSNPKVKACFSSVYTYVGFFLLFYLIAFVIEIKHTHTSCEQRYEYTSISNSGTQDCKGLYTPDLCDAPAMEIKHKYEGSTNDQPFRAENKLVCAWSTGTSVVNYIQIPALIFFFLLLFRVFKQRFKFLHTIIAGLVVAIFVILSIILMIKDISSGNDYKKTLALSAAYKYSNTVYVVNVVFLILAFISLLIIFGFAVKMNRQLNQSEPRADPESKPISEKERKKEQKRIEKENKKKEEERKKEEKKAQKNNKNKDAGKPEQQQPENDQYAPAIRI